MKRSILLVLFAWLLQAAVPAAAQVGLGGPVAAPELEVQVITPGEAENTLNPGSVIVNLAVRALDDDEEIVLLLDGEEVARDSRPPAFVVLNELERGTHQLQALIVDGDGDTVAESAVSTFEVFRASRLFPNRKPPVPVKPAPAPRPRPGGAPLRT